MPASLNDFEHARTFDQLEVPGEELVHVLSFSDDFEGGGCAPVAHVAGGHAHPWT
jgi:hypothetical protein